MIYDTVSSGEREPLSFERKGIPESADRLAEYTWGHGTVKAQLQNVGERNDAFAHREKVRTPDKRVDYVISRRWFELTTGAIWG